MEEGHAHLQQFEEHDIVKVTIRVHQRPSCKESYEIT